MYIPNADDDVPLHFEPAWSADLMLQAVSVITARIECIIRNNAASLPCAQKKLLVVRF